MVKIIVGQGRIAPIARVKFHRGVIRSHHPSHVPIVVHGHASIEITAPTMGYIVKILMAIEGRPAGAPHQAEHVASRHIAFAVEKGNQLGEHLAASEPWILCPSWIDIGESYGVLDQERSER